MRAGKVVLIVFGALIALVGFGVVAGGGTLVWAHTTQRDAAGFYSTPTDLVTTTSYALTSSVDFGTNSSQGDIWVPAHPAGTVRIQATSVNGQPVFIGIGPTAAVDTWLTGVAHEHVTSIAFGPFTTDTQQVYGTSTPTAPSGQTFWVASTSGSGHQTLTWPTEGGSWTVVVMNASAAAGVAVGVTVGMKTGLLLPIGVGLGVFGLLMLGLAALLLYLGLRTPRNMPQAPSGAGGPLETQSPTPPLVPTTSAAYPAHLDGHIDPTTSRWLWLVKWILVIPHAVVLAFLWVATVVLTVVAGFSILFTGHYPRRIFDFNVGVMRWTWRVVFYALGSFATDRYPPFSLARDVSYPADFDVDYPERLSRGLVLVKWWLLAIPQYIVVAFFAGGWSAGLSGAWRGVVAYGLIGVLALISAVILGFSGRYPDSLFDFIMGMHRWCYRVFAYVALMRDEYPPFRLDAGGTDPGSMPVPPPSPPPPAPARSSELAGTAVGAGAAPDV
jgi:hypothetical protein